MKYGLIARFIVTVFISFQISETICQEPEQNLRLPHFLFQEFTKGVIKMKDGRKMSAILNYNMVDEEMIFQQRNQYMVLNKPEEIDTVFIQNRLFVYKKNAFFELISSGTYDFFIQHKAKYTETGTTTAYGIKSPTVEKFNATAIEGGNQVRHIEMPDKVKVVSSPVFWVERESEFMKFLNDKQLIKLFPERAKELKEYIIKTGSDIKTPEGLKAVANFLNEKLF